MEDTPPSPTQPLVAAPTLTRKVTLFLLAMISVAMALRGLSVGGAPAGIELDESWRAVMGWAAANSAQFGTEIVFTYGPLGFLHPEAAYVPDVYPWFLAGQAILATLAGLSSFLLLVRMGPSLRLLFCASGLAIAPWVFADVLWLLVLAQGSVLLCLPWINDSTPTAIEADTTSPRLNSIMALVLGLNAAAIALIKFSMLPTALILVFAASAALAIGRRARQGALHLGGFLLGLPALWVACGQGISNIPSYLVNSLEIATGYTDAMGLMPHPLVDLLGLAAVLAAGGWLAWQVVAQRHRPARSLMLFALGCVAFVAWRQGFTRADSHVLQAFPVFAMLPVYGLALLGVTRDRTTGTAVIASFIPIAVVFTFMQNVLAPSRWVELVEASAYVAGAYTNPAALVEQRETIADELRAKYPIEAIRNDVGDETIDTLNWSQGLLVLHGMNYRPRPVFQSYSAYTPHLMRLNEGHFLREDAPRNVLVMLQAIDGRLAVGDDILALQAVIRGYRPIREEAGFLLLRRTVEGELAASEPPRLTQHARLGEWIEVPPGGALQTLAVDVRPSLRGRLYALGFRTPPLMLELVTETGEQFAYRLLPRAAAAGVPINPLVRSTDDLRAMLAGQPGTRVIRVRIDSALPNYAGMWEAEIDVGFANMPVAPQSP